VTPVGDGAVAAMVAEARRRLDADGLLDRPRRPIPRLPSAIGVICGSEAAVRKDIESVVAARFPGYPVQVFVTPVSGPGAALSIIAALEEVAEAPAVEVVILARGGGDATQLLPWSDEELCRAICACPVPVVSAIGHEDDRPLCDEVADLRCGTPSLAATAVVPDRAALVAELAAWREQSRRAAARHVDAAGLRLAGIDTARAASAGLGLASGRLIRVADQLTLLEPRRRLPEAARRLAAVDRSGPAMRGLERASAHLQGVDWRGPPARRVEQARSRLSGDRRHLDAVSPKGVLARGYAVIRTPGGQIVLDAAGLRQGDPIDVQLASGRLTARVEEVVDERR